MEENNKAYDYAMFLLNIRLRTEGELREKFRSKNYELGITDGVIKQLKDQHCIDDQRFAEVYLENLKKYKNWGYYGIKKKFMEKRLPSNIIESVLNDGLSEEEELEIAKRFLKKESSHFVIARSAADEAIYLKRSSRSFRQGRGSLAMTEKQKAARKLAAKGFRSSVISKMVF